MKVVSILVGILWILFDLTTSEKILFVLPIASKSHVNVFQPLIRELAERGHDIVNLAPVASPKMPPNVRQINIVSIDEIFGQLSSPFEMRKLGKAQTLINGSFDSMWEACDLMQKSDQFQKLLLEEEFDLLIVDIFMNYCVLGIVPHFRAPSIMVTTFAAPSYITRFLGSRLPPSFVPNSHVEFTHAMSFTERFGNVIAEIVGELIGTYMFLKPAEKMYRRNFPNGSSLPGVDEIIASTSLVLSNSHFTLNYPRPLMPDIIEVGGMHTRPAKPLPKELNDFLAESGEDGFIFFSLGSIVPAKMMPEEYRKIFVNVFSRLKQRVIWKWETETMPDVTPNVLLRKWLPQQDILGHPNIKLFMTHGGLLSTQEAAYHGVPLVGFPIFGDQDLNIKQAEKAGYAKYFEILNISEEKLANTINEVINNASFSQRAKDLSKVVRDLPRTPLEEAAYWCEYVIRHKGAPHLRSAARDLNFFQYYLLDISLVLAIVLILILYVTYKTTKVIYLRLFGGKSMKVSGKFKHKKQS